MINVCETDNIVVNVHLFEENKPIVFDYLTFPRTGETK